MLGQSEHFKRLDVSQRIGRRADRRTLCLEFGHCAKDQTLRQGDRKLWEVNMPIEQYAKGEDDAPKDRTKH